MTRVQRQYFFQKTSIWHILLTLPSSELHYCTGAYRISPTDVNSRPSSCLTNFLLNGKLFILRYILHFIVQYINIYTYICIHIYKHIYIHIHVYTYTRIYTQYVNMCVNICNSYIYKYTHIHIHIYDIHVCWTICPYLPTSGRSVLLELPKKSGSKVISHMLSSHGGEIFLHVLNSNRSTLEDPPSISEGCGGRVTDYRITVSSAHFISCVLKIDARLFFGDKLFWIFFVSGLWWIHEGEQANSSFREFPQSFWKAAIWEGQVAAGAVHTILANDHLTNHHI